MKKSTLKEILIELINEAPSQQITATSVFQKVPFGQRGPDDADFDLSDADVQQLIIEYIKKYKIPTGYAEILLRLPKVVDMDNLDRIVDEALELFYNIMGGEDFDVDDYQSESTSRKILFPKDWKQMEKIRSGAQLKNFKFTGGVKYSVLLTYIKKLFLFMEEELTKDDDVTFPEYTDDYNLPYERNTPAENELAKALNSWFGSSNTPSANTFKKYYPVIQQAKSKFPKVFSPGKPKSPVYRGTTVGPSVVSTLQNSRVEDWKRITDDGETYMVYLKPVIYSPKRVAQSWTTDPSTAQEFDSTCVLITGISDQFFLNDQSSDALGGYNFSEAEVIHVGKTFVHPVFIAVDLETWEDYNLTDSAGDFQKAAGSLLGTKTPVKKAVKKVAKKPVKKVAKKSITKK